MLKLFLRLHALKDWLSDRAKRKTPHRFGRVGGVFVSSLFAFLIPVMTRAAAPGASAAALGGLSVLDTIAGTLANIAYSIAGILTQGIVLMIDLMVPIMTYNSFVTNKVVSAGWAIMRDTVNMFFVIVLIIIAFGTIFGHSKFQWSQQVPKLLTFAIVINFSKTLCGIMIDFGQVIMLTFANALREIAAGNFIQLLGLNQLYQVSTNIQALNDVGTAAGKTIDNFDYLGGGIMSVLLTLWVLGTLIMLVVILIYRIIGLWILVVISPLAWFVGGAGGSSGIIQSDAYAKWWDRFKCLVGVGPVLTFFLWLTLAVAGAGNIAAETGFNVSSANSADLASKLLEPQHFMSFLIGMAMLFAGFDAAQQLCSSLSGGVLGKSLQKARGGVLAKGAAALGLGAGGLGLKAGGAGLRLGAKGAYRAPSAAVTVASYLPGSSAVARGYASARESVKTGAGSIVQKTGKVTGLRTLERLGVGVQARSKAQAGLARTEDMKLAKEGMKNKGRDEKLNLMRTYANQVARGGSLSAKEDAQYKALLDETMGDKRMQKEARADGTLQKAWAQKGNEFTNDNKHDAAKLDQINDFKKSNADITKSAGLISTWDDVKGLNDDALKDKAIQERLRNVKSDVRGADGEYLSAYDAVSKGLGGAGDAKKNALTSGEGEKYERMNDAELARVNVTTLGEKGTADGMRKAIEAAMRSGDENRARTLMSNLGAKFHGATDPSERMKIVTVMRETAQNVGAMKPGSSSAQHMNRVTRGVDEAVQRDVGRVETEQKSRLEPAREKVTQELDQLARDLAAARSQVAAQLQATADRAEQTAQRAAADPMNRPQDKAAARAEADAAKEAAKPENVDKASTVVNILNRITKKEAEKVNPVVDPATDEGKEFAKVEAQLNAMRAYLKKREEEKKARTT